MKRHPLWPPFHHVPPHQLTGPHVALTHLSTFLTYTVHLIHITSPSFMSVFVQPQYVPVPTVFDQVGDPGYVYPILIVGMVFFMASNVMPNILPEAQRVM